MAGERQTEAQEIIELLKDIRLGLKFILGVLSAIAVIVLAHG